MNPDGIFFDPKLIHQWVKITQNTPGSATYTATNGKFVAVDPAEVSPPPAFENPYADIEDSDDVDLIQEVEALYSADKKNRPYPHEIVDVVRHAGWVPGHELEAAEAQIAELQEQIEEMKRLEEDRRAKFEAMSPPPRGVDRSIATGASVPPSLPRWGDYTAPRGPKSLTPLADWQKIIADHGTPKPGPAPEFKIFDPLQKPETTTERQIQLYKKYLRGIY